LAKEIYREDDFTLFEIQFGLAEAFEKAGQLDAANQIFDKCFSSIDGRMDDNKSVRSNVSRNLSIKARTNSLVSYGGGGGTLGRRNTRMDT
jgi:hypothetical protein